MSQESLELAALFVLWIVCGMVGFVIGRARGRRPAGLGFGFILGPLGWLITLCLSNARRKCVWCKFQIPDGAIVCGHCGRELV